MSEIYLSKELLIKGIPKLVSSFDTKEQELIIPGQGVSSVVLKERASLAWEIYNEDKTAGLKLEVLESEAVLYELIIHDDFGKRFQEWSRVHSCEKTIAGLDADKDCVYWFSIDGPNHRISYGKGEMRRATTLLEYPPLLDKSINIEWLKEVSEVVIDTSAPSLQSDIYRDPVTIDPSLIVLDTDKISMMDMASNKATVAANLTAACQTIHANITGNNFQLDTPDFPDFVKAIEASIKESDGWCYNKLQEKADEDEFGGGYQETYLRITLGVNQGDSPGIPNVMEIWPPGHHSPIHNHGDANAIIRVLHGEIQVDLYAMLSLEHTTPFATKNFVKDQVTWLSPGLNQIHKLTNPNSDGSTCITIQSYMYGQENTYHYEYFDFIDEDKDKIEPFTPNSDMGFIEFKETIKKEWDARQKAEASTNDVALAAGVSHSF